MAAFDFSRSTRWARSIARTNLSPRGDDELPFIGDVPTAGQELLLDTCVYIDGLQGRAPAAVYDLLDIRHANHSTVAVQELMHTVGALAPDHPGTKRAVRQIGSLIESMPRHRLFTPDADVLGRAALLSGILSRLLGYRRDDRLRILQDSVLFLQAWRLGFTVLTANRRDFDFLLQLVPAGRVLFYRAVRSQLMPT